MYNALYYAKNILKGYFTYRNIRKKYGKKATLFLCPHKATGDIYILGLYFPTYLKKNSISDYVFTVVGKGDAKVARMYEINNIEALTQEEMDNVVRFSIFVGRKQTKVKILHYRAVSMHMGIIDNLRNYKSLNFAEMLLYIVFQLPFNTPQQLPHFRKNQNYVEQIFTERNLIPHKTVVLSPYSNSVPCINQTFWERLALNLKNNGFTVCTNSIGSSEPIIASTVPIYFSYENAKTFLEYAGYFIGVRSGLCDIISSFKCKKIIINQPNIRFGVGNVLEYFSLKDMRLDQHTTELEYHEEYEERILHYIIQDIQEGIQ